MLGTTTTATGSGTPDPVRALRISRLLSGARADLASSEACKAAYYATAPQKGRDAIDAEIAQRRGHVAMWEKKLAELGGAA